MVQKLHSSVGSCKLLNCACCCSKEVVTKLQAELRQAQDAAAAAAKQLDVVSQENTQLHTQLQQSTTHRQDNDGMHGCMTVNDLSYCYEMPAYVPYYQG